MIRHRYARLVALLILFLFPIVARGADARLAPGSWLSVKGSFDEQGIFQAQEIARLDDRSASVKGEIEGYTQTNGELVFGPLRLTIDSETRVQDGRGEALPPERLGVGQRAKVALDLETGGSLHARRVHLLDGRSSNRLRLEGPVEFVLSRNANDVHFTLLGVEVRADSRTAWEAVQRPVAEIDDEDVRPARGVQLGKLGRFSGEVRFDFKGKSNFDLADQLDTDLNTRRLRTRLELVFPSTPRISGMFQIKMENEKEIDDEADDFEDRQHLRLGRAYVLFRGILGRHGSLQVGRSRFDDRRDWLYNRDVDAVRFFFESFRLRLEASVSQEVVDPVKRHRDTFNTHLLVRGILGRRHSVAAYVLDRHDRFRTAGGDLRDFSPRLFGLKASGEGKRLWSYWLEAALARGSLEGEKMEGRALDAGLSLVLPVALEPSLTLGYAFGSGDDDPFDGVNHTFRQSGLHLNNGKWNGVASFRYYGELLRPELANLHVETYGIGLRPRRKTSIDLIYHEYRLDKPASELVDADVSDRRLNLVDLEVGREWDLVVGFEEIPHLEFELDLSYFEPGDAFLGPTDPALMARLKAKYVF